MKVLILMPYTPVPANFGGAIRIYYLLKSLAHEHEVTVLAFGTPDRERLIKEEFGRLVQDIHIIPEPWSRKYKRPGQLYSMFTSKSYSNICCYSNRMQEKIDELLLQGEYDVVHCEFPCMGQYKLKNGVRKILDAHNVEYENFRRMWKKSRSSLRGWYYKKEYQKEFKEEVRALQAQDIIMATSKDDIEIIRKDVSGVPGFVVPNGVDTSFFTPSQAKPEPYSIVFTGMMGYTPNSDGMLWFLDDIFPLILEKIPQARVYIVGSRPPESLKKRQSDNIIVTGFVDDVRPYVWKSSVFVVPLRMGSGTRLKVVEALAMKKPVVSTSIGCEGIDVEHNRSILIEDYPEVFAERVVELLKNKQLRDRLTKEGYDLVTSKYDWSVVGETMLEVYKNFQIGNKAEHAAPVRVEAPS
jgi:glycosyltransferase involved in cell wall biosynthesis